MLYSDNACRNIISHIAKQTCSEISKYVMQKKPSFQLMVGESTSISNAQYLIVYVRTMYDGVLYTYFLSLLPIVNPTAASIEGIFTEFLVKQGLKTT